jgi:hypothetical protein
VQLILEGNAEERTFVVTSGGVPLANAFVFVHGGAAMRVATTWFPSMDQVLHGRGGREMPRRITPVVVPSSINRSYP